MSDSAQEYLIVPWEGHRKGIPSQARSHILRARRKATGHKPDLQASHASSSNAHARVSISELSFQQGAHYVSQKVQRDDLTLSTGTNNENQSDSEHGTRMPEVQAEDRNEILLPEGGVDDLERVKQRSEVPNALTQQSALSPPAIGNAFMSYFTSHAAKMLHLDLGPRRIQAGRIHQTLLEFAKTGPWCFGTIVVVLSAKYLSMESGSELPDGRVRLYVEEVVNEMLRLAFTRVEALTQDGSSGDEDVLALMFLAVSDWLYGSQRQGCLHMAGWSAYMAERDRQGVQKCAPAVQEVVDWVTHLMSFTNCVSQRAGLGQCASSRSSINEISDVSGILPPALDIESLTMEE